MHFGFALDSSDIDLWETDLLDIHLDLYIYTLQIFPVNRLLVSKTSSRRLHNMSSRHVFKTYLRRLQGNNFFVFQDLFKTKNYWRRRRVEDVFKTCLENVLKTCWKRLEDQ